MLIRKYTFFVQNDRTLSLALPFRPVVRVSVTDEDFRREVVVSQFYKGTVHKLTCIDRGQGESIEIDNIFYAHRTNPSIFEQDVTIRNPTSSDVMVHFDQLGWTGEPPFTSDIKKFVIFVQIYKVLYAFFSYYIMFSCVQMFCYLKPTRFYRIKQGDEEIIYVVANGIVESAGKPPIVVAMAYKKVPNALEVSDN